MIVGLAIGGVLWLAMLGTSYHGWLTLPADARVPVHFGAGYNNFVPKRAGLIVHPAAGAVVFGILASVNNAGPANNTPSHGPPYVILVVTMAVLLIVQIGAIRVARRRSGG